MADLYDELCAALREMREEEEARKALEITPYYAEVGATPGIWYKLFINENENGLLEPDYSCNGVEVEGAPLDLMSAIRDIARGS